MQTSEHSKLALKIPPVVVLLLALLAVYITDQVLPMSGFFDEWRYSISLGLLVIAVVIAFAGMVSFKRANTTVHPVKIEKASQLVTSGMFRFSRNPMYLGMLLITIALAVRLDNPFALVWALGFQQYMNRYQIGPEERMLTQLFGDAYKQYMTRVRRWL